MNTRLRNDLIVIGAGVAGLAVGQIVLDRLEVDADRDKSSAVNAARLATAMALAGRVADTARFGRVAVGSRAAIAFAVASGSVLAAPMLRRALRNRSP